MTYPLATLAPTIGLTGISIPTYEDVYQSLIASFKAIYGNDIYVAPDSQDGQWIAVLAQAITDSNQAAVACFQAFSPTYAQGTGLSSLVKLNGISRKVATHSTAVGDLGGVAGTTIIGGVVQDAAGNLWDVPSPSVIPLSGTLTVTVTAQKAGSISAIVGSINKIYNPQYGWQSFTNTSAATAGSAVETDAELRRRQAFSSAIPSLSILDGILAGIGNVSGVTRWTVYENDTGTTDANGIPAHSISAVVAGGSSAAIAAAIALRKPPGAQTYGSTTVTVYDAYGLATNINYYTLSTTNIYFDVTIKALTGYVSTTGTALVAALVDFVNALDIGEDVYVSQAQAAASLIGLGIGQTFYITAFKLGTAPAPVGTSNLTIAFNAAAACATANVTLTVT